MPLRGKVLCSFATKTPCPTPYTFGEGEGARRGTTSCCAPPYPPPSRDLLARAPTCPVGARQHLFNPTCPTPYTLHLTPYTLHLTPYTLHLTPSVKVKVKVKVKVRGRASVGQVGAREGVAPTEYGVDWHGTCALQVKILNCK